MAEDQDPLVIPLADLRRGYVARVGGKNASLGEMIAGLAEAGVRVPEGFATTAAAYRAFLAANDLEGRLAETLGRLAPDRANLAEIGRDCRRLIGEGDIPEPLDTAIAAAYAEMGGNGDPPAVAVRSSATAEDLPEASFAGQLETFLNIRGEDALLGAVKRCFASLFTDRAIAYRENNGFDHMAVALSVGVQRMVRSDLAGSGVMFSIDTETGFPDAVLINAAWGLGEMVVQGAVDPDEYRVFKPLLGREGLVPVVEKTLGRKGRKMVLGEGEAPTRVVETDADAQARFVLTDEEILDLARWAVAIEDHYGQPMDMEWAKDGETNALFIVQARPETVQSRREAGTLKSYRLAAKAEPIVTGLSIGDAIAAGPVCKLAGPGEIERFTPGSVLVTEMTDPDWVPIMKKAAAIVTDHGGRTSHAAIVSRELGLTAVVGAGDGTARLEDGMEVTVSCAEGEEGYVYEGRLDFTVEDLDLDAVPETETEVMLNLANPAAAFRWWRLPAAGVGLARMEFIVNNLIKIHPMALVRPEAVEDDAARARIAELTRGYESGTEYFVDTLARGIARIAAAWYPRPVILRMSDFKTNEYARLIGGAAFEPAEENPMLGWRGASRYYHEGYREGFGLECRAVARAREIIGMDNIVVMIPFCRTTGEADKVLAEMARHGLERGKTGLEVYVMCEIPANVLLAEDFSARFDGFSIGSNDLTQLTLGVDRDSDILSALFDETDPAVETAIAMLLESARKTGTKTGLCGQRPSDDPDFARFLVAHGIDSISVSPDSFIAVKRIVAEAEASR